MQISISDKNITDAVPQPPQQTQEKNTGISFSELLQNKTSEAGILNIENHNEIPDIDFAMDAVSMDFNDAMFFINLAHEGQFSVQPSPEGGIQSIVQIETAQNTAVKKSAAVTNQVINLIEKAQKTQKPVRISFDNDISVVLKIDKKGKLSAEFIPGSIEAEKYLSANVSALKQRFDEQNLPYTNLSYRQSSRNGRNDRNRNNRENNRGEA